MSYKESKICTNSNIFYIKLILAAKIYFKILLALQTIVAMRDKQKLEQYRENVKFDANLRQRIQNLFVDNVSKLVIMMFLVFIVAFITRFSYIKR